MNATLRNLRDDLDHMRVWLDIWAIDAKHNLVCSTDGINSASATLRRAMARLEELDGDPFRKLETLIVERAP